MHPRRIAIAAVSTLLCLDLAAAQGSCEGPFPRFFELQAMAVGAQVTEFHRALPCAERGFSGASITIATMYRWGYGVPENIERSNFFLRRAVEQGAFEAAQPLRMAAQQGEPGALENLNALV